MNTETIRISSLLSYELKRAGANYLIGPCPLCGGVDRFTVKHTPKGDRWLCRKCSGDGKYRDVIDFIRRRDRCDFQTALKTLGQVAPVAPWSRLKEPEIKPLQLPSADWQRDAWRHVDGAGDELFSIHGLAGREYLASRGLSKTTAYAWHLGFARVYDPISKCTRPAIVIPWVTKTDREITAVKYRYIDDIPNAGRYAYMAGSVPVLFGGWDLMSSDQTLLLIEGEINCMSIWQYRPRGLSVVSFGSEPEGEIPQSRAVIIQDLARNYANIIIWMDSGQRSKQYAKVLGRACRKLQSPGMEGIKADANQLLIMGELHSFIEKVLGIDCMNGEVESMA